MSKSQTGPEATTEVVRLHEFFVRWLGGTSGAHEGVSRDEDWTKFEASLHPDFEMVVPSGVTLTRSELLQSFGPAFGTRPGLKIDIRDARALDVNGDSVLMRYEEWQEFAAPEGETETTTTARVSMVLLRRSSSAPAGWQWLQLQETWLAVPGS